MNSAESLVPASIRIACSSVEGASTLSEVRVVGLYQYIFCVLLLPERDDVLNVPGATSNETGVLCEFRLNRVPRTLFRRPPCGEKDIQDTRRRTVPPLLEPRPAFFLVLPASGPF